MSPWDLRMLALDRRDDAIDYLIHAKSYRREGRTGMCRSYARKALKQWRKYRDLLKAAEKQAEQEHRRAA